MEYKHLIKAAESSRTNFYLPYIGNYHIFNESTTAPLDHFLPLRSCRSLTASKNYNSIEEFALDKSEAERYILLGGSTASGLYTKGLECFPGDYLSQVHKIQTHTLALPSHNIYQQLLLLFALSTSFPSLRQANLIFYIGYNEIAQSLPLQRLGFFPSVDDIYLATGDESKEIFQSWFSLLKANNQNTSSIKFNISSIGKTIDSFIQYNRKRRTLLSQELGLGFFRNSFASVVSQIKKEKATLSRYELILNSINDGRNCPWVDDAYSDIYLLFRRLIDISLPLLKEWASDPSNPKITIFLQRPFLYSLSEPSRLADSLAYELTSNSSALQITKEIMIYRLMPDLYKFLANSFKNCSSIEVFTGNDCRGFEFSTAPARQYIDHCHLNESGFKDLTDAIAGAIS